MLFKFQFDIITLPPSVKSFDGVAATQTLSLNPVERLPAPLGVQSSSLPAVARVSVIMTVLCSCSLFVQNIYGNVITHVL